MQIGGMNAKLAGMNASDLQRRIDEDPTAVVMQPTYDNTFDPWDARQIRLHVNTISTAARVGGRSEVQRVLDSSKDARQFARLHPKLYKHVSNPDVAANEALMGVIEQMLTERARVHSGLVTDTEARATVSDTALKAVIAAGKVTQAAAGSASAPEEESRIEEITDPVELPVAGGGGATAGGSGQETSTDL